MIKKSKNTFINTSLFILLMLIAFLGYTVYLKYSALPSEDEIYPSGKIIQVEVLNATDETGLAEKLAEYLRARKFDVVNQNNYHTKNVSRSFIIDRVGNEIYAKKVAKTLGIGYDRIVKDSSRDLFLDATIVIGDDYKKLKME